MYGWLDQQSDAFFQHFKVVHAKGEFSRRGAGGELISTNGVEGLFSRMKRLLRGYRASPSDTSQYGDYLGEFLWRMRFVLAEEDDSWRRNAFWELVRVLKWKHKPNFVDPDSRWAPPADLQAEFDALQAAAALPRTRRPGGRFGKRSRPLAIEVLTLGRVGVSCRIAVFVSWWGLFQEEQDLVLGFFARTRKVMSSKQSPLDECTLVRMGWWKIRQRELFNCHLRRRC